MEAEIISLLGNLSNYKRYSSLVREERLSEDYRDIYKSLNNYFKEVDVIDIVGCKINDASMRCE